MGFQFGNQIFPATNNFDFTNQDLANIWFVLFNAFGGGGANNVAPARKFGFLIQGVTSNPGVGGNSITYDLSFLNTIFNTGDKIALRWNSLELVIDILGIGGGKLNTLFTLCGSPFVAPLAQIDSSVTPLTTVNLLTSQTYYESLGFVAAGQQIQNHQLPIGQCAQTIPIAVPNLVVSVGIQGTFVVPGLFIPLANIEVELLNPQ